jgi:hypothetical protein
VQCYVTANELLLSAADTATATATATAAAGGRCVDLNENAHSLLLSYASIIIFSLLWLTDEGSTADTHSLCSQSARH